MIFDLTRSTSEYKKIVALDPNYPQDVTVNIIKGNTTSATFTVEILAHGKPAEYTYQWYVDNQPVSGVNGPSYTIYDITDEITHKIYCDVTNKKGTVSSRIATLTVTQSYPPTLDDSFPKDATLTIGESVTCEVVILDEGEPAVYTYQWYKDGAAVGANSSSYSFTPDKAGKSTLYCEVANSAGKVTSRTATITAKNKALYEAGDQYNDITGGWGSSGWSSGYSPYSISAPTINTSGITLQGAGSSKLVTAGTGNKIDLRNVNTLYVTVDSYGITNPYESAVFAVNREKKVAPEGTGYTMTAMVKITKTGEIALNVGSINEGYVVVFLHSGSATVRITKIRME